LHEGIVKIIEKGWFGSREKTSIDTTYTTKELLFNMYKSRILFFF
jgi:hypothetical protein